MLGELLPDSPLSGEKPVLAYPRNVVDEITSAGFETVAVEDLGVSVDEPPFDDAWRPCARVRPFERETAESVARAPGG